MQISVSIYCILISFLLFGCRTVKESDFRVSKNSLGTILPGLEGNVDLDNIQKYLSYGKIKLSGYYHGVIKVKEDTDSLKLFMIDKNLSFNQQKVNNQSDSLVVFIEDSEFKKKDYIMNPDKYYTKAEFKTDQRVDDLIKQFSYELKRGTGADSLMKGSVHLELLSFREKRSTPLLFLSAWTLCSSALVGIPLTYVTTSLEIQLTIYNSRNQTAGQYRSKGKGTAWIALYWGYGKDGWRKSALKALSDAMSSTKQAIEADKEKIGATLDQK